MGLQVENCAMKNRKRNMSFHMDWFLDRRFDAVLIWLYWIRDQICFHGWSGRCYTLLIPRSNAIYKIPFLSPSMIEIERLINEFITFISHTFHSQSLSSMKTRINKTTITTTHRPRYLKKKKKAIIYASTYIQ